MKNLPHYFIAIPISPTLKNMLLEWQKDLIEKLPYKQWLHKHDLHITLKFLGPVDENTLKALQTELKQLENLSNFSLTTGGIGTFGNPSSPRVLWVGVEKSENLSALHKRVEECAARHGFNEDRRRYHPHITLAKKWNGTIDHCVLSDAKKHYNDNTHVLSVNEAVIYQIHPKHSPKYEIISSYLLKGG